MKFSWSQTCRVFAALSGVYGSVYLMRKDKTYCDYSGISSTAKKFKSLTKNKNGESVPFMDTVGFLNAIMPFVVEENVLNHKDVSRRCADLFRRVDVSGDGKIDFKEFLFFQKMMDISLNVFRIAFAAIDLDNNNELDAEEFFNFLTLVARRSDPSISDKELEAFLQAARHSQLMTRLFKQEKRDSLINNSSGPTSKNCSCDDLVREVSSLKNAVIGVQFAVLMAMDEMRLGTPLKSKEGLPMVSCGTFLSFLLASVPFYSNSSKVFQQEFLRVEERLKKDCASWKRAMKEVDAVDEEDMFSRRDAVALRELLTKRESLANAITLAAYAELPIDSPLSLRRACEASGVSVSPPLSRLLFAVMDRNNSGIIDAEEAMGLLNSMTERFELANNNQEVEIIGGGFGEFWRCAFSKKA